MQSIFYNNFIRIMCKSNIRYFNVVVVINLWNTLPNSIKNVKSDVSFKLNIKSIHLKLYINEFKCLCIYNNLYLCIILFYYYIILLHVLQTIITNIFISIFGDLYVFCSKSSMHQFLSRQH